MPVRTRRGSGSTVEPAAGHVDMNRNDRRRGSRLLRIAVLLVAVASVVVAVPASPVFADPALITNDNQSSCVWTYAGSVSAGFTLNTVPLRLSYKCYRAVDPGEREWDSGGWIDSTSASPAYLFTGQTSSIVTSFSSTSGTNRFSDFTIDVADDSIGYVEFSFNIYRTSGSAVYNSSRIAYVGLDAGGSAPYDDLIGYTAARISWVSAASFDAAEPAYRWSDVYEPTVPFCGAEVTFVDPTINETVRQGDTVEVEWEATAGVTAQIDLQWMPIDSPGEAWEGSPLLRWYEIRPATSIATSGSKTLTVPNLYDFTSGVLLGRVNLRCFDLRTDTWRYKNAEDPSTVISLAEQYPCSQTRVEWPYRRNLSAGDTQRWWISHRIIGYTGTDPDVLIEYATWDDGTLTGPPAYSSLTWETVADLSPGEGGFYDLEAGYDGTSAQYLLRCVDETGTYYNGKWAPGMKLGEDPTESGEPRSEASCLRQSGIGLSPSSWVPGLVGMGTCTLRVLFIPSGAALSDLEASGDALADRAPVSFLAESADMLYGALDGSAAAVEANEDDCVQLLGSNLLDDVAPAYSYPVEACPTAIAGGTVTTTRSVVGVAFWFGAAWMLWGMTRRLLAR